MGEIPKKKGRKNKRRSDEEKRSVPAMAVDRSRSREIH